MGCSKNLVDSELLMKQFEANGYHCVHDSKNPKGEIVVINTCGFIESAKEESINTILEFAQAKEEGRLKQLYVMGCLSQRYQKELEQEIPQVDRFYGKFNYKNLLKDLGKGVIASCNGTRSITTPRHYAYLKISEGCDRSCAYCAIPLITGKHVSRPKSKPNVCKYIDIALQHISDNMLTRMHRHVTKAQTMELIKRIREEIPGIHLRTTLMVGFPGETDDDFNELLDFVKWARFERMGAFIYSEEEGTYSAKHYEDNVPNEVKQRRLDQLMALQQEISAEVEAQKVGKTLRVIIDRKEGDYYIGRTEWASPEVDPEVLIPATMRLRVGKFYNVRITDSEEFDLYGEIE